MKPPTCERSDQDSSYRSTGAPSRVAERHVVRYVARAASTRAFSRASRVKRISSAAGGGTTVRSGFERALAISPAPALSRATKGVRTYHGADGAACSRFEAIGAACATARSRTAALKGEYLPGVEACSSAATSS